MGRSPSQLLDVLSGEHRTVERAGRQWEVLLRGTGAPPRGDQSMIIDPKKSGLTVEVEPLIVRFTLSKPLPPAAMGPIIDRIRRGIHHMIEAEMAVYDEAPVQPPNGYALELRFGLQHSAENRELVERIEAETLTRAQTGTTTLNGSHPEMIIHRDDCSSLKDQKYPCDCQIEDTHE